MDSIACYLYELLRCFGRKARPSNLPNSVSVSVSASWASDSHRAVLCSALPLSNFLISMRAANGVVGMLGILPPPALIWIEVLYGPFVTPDR